MANKKNKVKFNIRNVHYAKLTIGEDGSITYSTPVAMPGAVSLSLDPNGEPSVFYADGYAYYTISNNQGYEASHYTSLSCWMERRSPHLYHRFNIVRAKHPSEILVRCRKEELDGRSI